MAVLPTPGSPIRPRRTVWRDDALFRKTLWSVLFWVMWLCVTIGWIANPEDDEQLTFGAALAGVVGTEVARLLFSLLHIGLPILLLFQACLFLVLVHNVRINLPERKVRPEDKVVAKPVVEPLEEDDEEGDEQPKGMKGFFSRLFHRHKEDDIDDEDEEQDDGENEDDHDGVEFESDSHLDNIVIDRVKKRIGAKEKPEDNKIVFNIDDEFERINSRAGRPSEEGPTFIVNAQPDIIGPSAVSKEAGRSMEYILR